MYFKRLFDLLMSIVLIIIISPLLILISLLIKLTSQGSIIFKQKRVGKDEKEFVIYKFRTMVKDAENKGSGYRVLKNDNRITKIGKILRKTSLDELPQLFNVLKGDMSLVGPRPTLKFIAEEYDEYQKNRFNMKPGITGLAQINGRQKLNWEEKIKYDLEYIKNYSFYLDIKILFKTFFVLLKSEDIHKEKDVKDDNSYIKE